MLWGLGDNVEFNLDHRELLNFWSQLNDLIAHVKKMDSHHPVITSISANHIQYFEDIKQNITSIDAIGINTFDQERFDAIPENIEKNQWNKPYIVTEFNFATECDIRKAPFEVPYWIEGDKLIAAEKSYQQVVVRHPQCLGAFMLT